MTSKREELKNHAPALDPALAANDSFSLISNKKLLDLYSALVKSRIVAERVQTILNQGKLKHRKLTANGRPAVGQEAAAVGVAIDLSPEDTVAFSTGSSYISCLIPCLVRGLPLETLLDGLFHPTAPSLGGPAQLKIATDAALANRLHQSRLHQNRLHQGKLHQSKLHKNNRIAVAFSSRASTALGFPHKALELADARRLPMIFVSWNSPNSLALRRSSTNSGANSSADSQTKAKSVSAKTMPYSFPAIPVDGNDVVAVYRVAHEAIGHARQGDGPTLIECIADGSERSDPLLNMESYLTRKGIFSERFKAEIAGEFNRKMDAALEKAGKP
jgi:pyruvate dehydrogenase E1 component alpha subunit